MNKLIFVHLPKTGGTLLRKLCLSAQQIINAASPQNPIQVQIGESHVINGAAAHASVSDFFDKDSAFKFGFVRNPFDWYVSRYFYFIKKHVEEKGVSIDSDSGLFGSDFQRKFPSLKDHIMYGDKEGKDNFWLTNLYKKMFYENDNLYMNYVGKLENIQQDINIIFSANCSRPINLDIESFNAQSGGVFVNKTNHMHYSQYYDQEIIDIIKEKDKLLLDKYNYEYEGDTK